MIPDHIYIINLLGLIAIVGLIIRVWILHTCFKTTVKTPSISSPIKIDAPILTSEQDLFGFNRLADTISEIIRKHNVENSVVIEINGKWGSGKTSLINLIIEKLQNSNSANVALEQFSTWGIHDHNQLLLQFLEIVRRAIGKHSTSKEATVFSKKIAIYAKLLAPLDTIPIANIASKGIQSIFSVINDIRDIDEHKTVTEIKDELDQLASKLDCKIVIFLDDIDRLYKNDIVHVLRLLKSVIDFPNTIYVLALDRRVAMEAISQHHFDPEKSFIEKLVQVSIDMPTLKEDNIAAILTENIERLVKANDITLSPRDVERFQNYFMSGLKDAFTDIRVVNRIINDYTIKLRLLRSITNAVDLFVVVTLLVVESDLYIIIKNNTKFFSSPDLKNDFPRQGEYNQIKDRIEAGLGRLSILKKHKTEELLSRLFPNVGYIFNNSADRMESTSEMNQSFRICMPEHIESYFKYGTSPEKVTKDELDRLIDILSNEAKPAKLQDFAVRLISLDKGYDLLQKIDEIDLATDHTNIPPAAIIRLLFSVGDDMPIIKKGWPFPSSTQLINNILFRCFDSIDTQDSRFKLVESLIDNISAKYTFIHFVEFIRYEHDPDNKYAKSLQKRTFSLQQMARLDKIALSMITELLHSRSEVLLNHPRAAFDLWYDIECNKEKVRQSASKHFQSSDQRLKFIDEYRSNKVTWGSSSYKATTTRPYDLDSLSKFFSLTDLCKELNILKKSDYYQTTTKENREIIDSYLSTCDSSKE